MRHDNGPDRFETRMGGPAGSVEVLWGEASHAGDLLLTMQDSRTLYLTPVEAQRACRKIWWHSAKPTDVEFDVVEADFKFDVVPVTGLP